MDRDCGETCAQDYADTCFYIQEGQGLGQLTIAWQTDLWLAIFNVTVALINIWFAALIWRNKSLQVHPM